MSRLPILALTAALLIPALAGGAAPAPAATLPLDAFLANDEINELLVSPDGEHYAVTVPQEDRTVLVVLRRADLKRTAQVTFPENVHVIDVAWVNNRQLVYSDARRYGRLEAPRRSGSLYRVNVDGSDMSAVSREYALLAGVQRGEGRLVRIVRYGGAGQPRLAWMDINTGKTEGKQYKHPLHGGTYFTDNAGKTRLASGVPTADIRSSQYLLDDQGKWRKIHSGQETGFPWYFQGFSADNGTAYFIKEEAEGPDGLYAYDMASGQHRLVTRHARVDVGRVLYSPIDGGVIAVEYFDGKPRLEVIEPDDPYARQLLKISRAFPDAYVTPTSYTADGRIGIYVVSSDVLPGEFYRVDHETGEATPIALRNLHLDPRRMSPTRPIRFKARDGLELEGFLTMPLAAGEGPAPLVLMPHGGPTGIFDRWAFDSEIQLLASRGYAVLRVNFRGSGNYGRAFREAANGEWGAKMQDDLTDATKWALQEGVTQPGRICIYGASYGAYAAMMGLVREPGLYQCGIGNVGLYDVQREYYDSRYTKFGDAYFGTAVGDVDMAAISPARLADKIRAPVLLGAGQFDRVTPVEQTRAMERGLKAAKVPHEVVVYKGEAHGYYKLENRRDWARRVLAFLDTHIGDAPAPAAAPQ